MIKKDMPKTGHTVVGVFEHVEQAERAINDLKVAGFTPDAISVVTKDRKVEVEGVGNEAAQGALVGSLGGGTLGAVLGWLLAGGTALIPGVGPIVAAGVFGATVGGALIGGTLGGIAGALAGAGVPEDEATEYTEFVKAGRTLVTVNAANGQLLEAAMDVFERNGATTTRYYDQSQPGPGRVFSRGEPISGGRTYTSTEPTETATQSNTQPSTFSGSSRSTDQDSNLSASSLGDERLGMDDISTLPDRNTGTSTRGGVSNDRPGGDMLPDRSSDRDKFPPTSI